MPVDLKELNIKLASSDRTIERIAGMVVRTLRRMPIDFLPGYLVNRDKFEYLLRKEDGEAERIRRTRQNDGK